MSDEYRAWLAGLKAGDEVAIRGLPLDGHITCVQRVSGGVVVTREGWRFHADTGSGFMRHISLTLGPPTARDRMVAKHVDLQREIRHAWNGSAKLGEELPDAELAEMVSRMERALAVLCGKMAGPEGDTTPWDETCATCQYKHITRVDEPCRECSKLPDRENLWEGRKI